MAEKGSRARWRPRLVSPPALRNVRSRRSPERLGFTQAGTHRQALWVHDHFKDLVSYSMLAREWSSKTRGVDFEA